ncbi:hypothetical protein [Maritalea sp.]|uniref:hypothetical protein n=1 Tax=Maritalea sp. TaxID=2003361 RepID=UPI0039E644B9
MGILRHTFMVIVVMFGLLPSMAYSASIEAKWFLHPFGEMRAYFGDFLAVCDQQGFQNCRIIQNGIGPDANSDGNLVAPAKGVFGNTRLAIQQNYDANNALIYTLEIFSTLLPNVPKGPMTLSIDGEVFQLKNDDWQAGSPEGYNVAQTFSVTDPSLNARLVAAMKKGNRLRVLHDGWTETRFQLRGITRALAAIELREFH